MSFNYNWPANAAWILAGAALMSGCGSLTSSQSGNTFNHRIYAGAGVLLSQLEPDASEVDGVGVDDTDSNGVGLLAGYDVNDRLSIEGHIADLGDATFSPDGSIAYQVAGVSGIVYGFNSRQNRLQRQGLSVFGRVGIGALNNKASGVRFKRVNDVHLLAGAGVEYGFNNALAARLEFVRHETDARHAQFALLYRFGAQGNRSGTSSPTAPPDRTQETLEFEIFDGPDQNPVDMDKPAGDVASDSVTESEDIDLPTAGMNGGELAAEGVELTESGESAQVDADLDSARDEIDDCSETAAGLPVDSVGCELFDGVVEGIHFLVDSDELTEGAFKVLGEILKILRDNPDINVTIEAHTDNVGNAAQNLQLSRRRALAVARFLIDEGISGLRLNPQAFGESQPRDTNQTREGRAANRRVEFNVFK